MEYKYSVYGLTLTLTPVPSALPNGWTNPNNIPLSGQTLQVTIDNTNFGKFVGLTVANYPSTSQSIITQFTSNSIALASNITTILIGCNLVSNCFYQTGFGDVIESFTPDQK